MNDKYESTDQSSPSPAKGVWEAPGIEELDFSSTENTPASTGPDGPYIS